MAIPKEFSNIVQRQLNIFAAWLPVVTNFSLGDYGIISDGVFSPLGNIKKDFNINFDEGAGNPAVLDFTSEGAVITKFVGNAKVDVIPAGAVDAKIEFDFTRERSFLVKAPEINVKTMQSLQQIGIKLQALDGWDSKWKVVHQVFTAIDPVIISSIQAATKVSFSGEAKALGQMKLGGADVAVNTSKALGLKIHGKTGPIGLGLFQVKTKLFGGMKVDILANAPVELQRLDPSKGNIEDDL